MSLARQTLLLGTHGLLALVALPLLAQASAAQLQYSECSKCLIDGTVVLEMEKRPAQGVVVTARLLPDGPSITLLTDDAGLFQFRDLPPGTYDVFAEEPGGYESEHTTTRVQDGSHSLRLHLKSRTMSQPALAGETVSVHQLRIPEKARAAFKEGWRLLLKNQASDSLPHFRRAIEVDPEFYEAYYGIGLANLSLGRLPETADALQKAIDLSAGQYLLAEFALGVTLWRSGQLVGAETALRRGLQGDPTYALGHLDLSVVLFDQGRLQDAEKSARAALLRNPKLATAYLVLARIHARWGNSSEQLNNLEKYLTLQPDDPQGTVRHLYDSLKSQQVSTRAASRP